MSEPTQWPGGGATETAGEARAAALLAEVRDPPSWSPNARREVLRRVRAEVDRPVGARISLWLPAVTVAAILGAVGVMAWRSQARVQADSPAEVAASSDAVFAWSHDLAEDRVLTLAIQAGTVEVRPRDPQATIAVHSPGLDARVTAETFRVQVAAEVTTLSIGEGQAWVGKVVHLRHHESIRSDDPRLKLSRKQPAPTPVAPVVPAVSPRSCSPSGSVADRRACYVELARGRDLGAQNALFELGMLDQEERHAGPEALQSFQDYEARFPDGPLASDAAFAAFAELAAERRGPEARREGEQFLQRYPRDARAPEVRARLRGLP